LAHRQFQAVAKGTVRTSRTRTFGSPAFYQSDLGQTWTALLSQAAQWVADKTACLPFIARITRLDGQRIYLDAGAESGLLANVKLHLHRVNQQPIQALDGSLLGHEKQLGPGLRIVQVYPMFAIAELDPRPLTAPTLKIGDLLYLQ
jgi:hypothetical protein